MRRYGLLIVSRSNIDCANTSKTPINRCGVSRTHTCSFMMSICRVHRQMWRPTLRPVRCAHSELIANWRQTICDKQQPNKMRIAFDHWPNSRSWIRTIEFIVRIRVLLLCNIAHVISYQVRSNAILICYFWYTFSPHTDGQWNLWNLYTFVYYYIFTGTKIRE